MPYKILLAFFALLFLFALAPHEHSHATTNPLLIRSPQDSAVYLLDEEGIRHVFPNATTYFTWFEDFSPVEIWPQETVNQYPLGKNVTIKPGTKLVKQYFLPAVYEVHEGGELVQIASEEEALSRYGVNWASNVVDIPDVFWFNYRVISQTQTPETAPVTTALYTPMYDHTIWPTDSHILSDTFGPREKDGRYDFHRGIDIPDDLGSPIYAIADGEVYQIFHEGEEGNPFPDGGTVVIIKHEMDKPFDFHGEAYDTYYSYYLHLQEVADGLIVGDEVPQDLKIGTMGNSGTTDFVHLHFEIRVGTSCSHEYQMSHPTAQCAQILPENADPHVHPLHFLSYEMSSDIQIEHVNDSTIRIETPAEKLDLNRFEILTSNGWRVIDWDQREGVDLSNIDNPVYEEFEVTPLLFNRSSENYALEIATTDQTEILSVIVTDIQGDSLRIDF